jgi:uncharacterized membrane protein
MMFGAGRTKGLQQNTADATELALQLARDKKFRKQLASAVGHGIAARRRARRRLGLTAAAARLASDDELRRAVARAGRDLQGAWARVEKKRRHRVRRTILLVAGAGAVTAAAVPSSRSWLAQRFGNPGAGRRFGPRTIAADLEVAVPVSTAYNQWTQFEEFPQFMAGVEQVRQIDDTRLHWVANLGGKKAVWDAKILEQHPDKQVSWVSEDGKKTRGTVTFEPLGDNRTRVGLSMSYQAEGFLEAVGAAAGIDKRRVEGDLERFKELVESRGTASDAWRGEISDGETT